MRTPLLLFAAILCAACSSSSSPAPDMSVVSCCGKPGDKAINSLGIGKYCANVADCQGNAMATLCSSQGNTDKRKTFFCTMLCQKGMTDCGAGASCECDPNNPSACACTPTSCLTDPTLPASCIAERPMGDMRMTTGDMAVTSCCGKPGDTGNNLGVGKYCMTLADCNNNGMATLCSSLGNTDKRKTFFCTFLCQMGMTNCGTGATCACDPMNPSNCACTPNMCIMTPPPGC
jgi:hypothetical protein